MNINVTKDVLSEPDLSPAYKVMDVSVVVDSRHTLREQLHAAYYEILSAWLDPAEIHRERNCRIASDLIDAWQALGACSEK